MYHKHLLLAVNISSNELVLLNLLLIQKVFFKVFLKDYRFLFRVPISRFLSKKKKIAEITLIVIRCHSLPFAVTLSHSLYRSLSFAVIRCHSMYHSLSIVVTRCITRLVTAAFHYFHYNSYHDYHFHCIFTV